MNLSNPTHHQPSSKRLPFLLPYLAMLQLAEIKNKKNEAEKTVLQHYANYMYLSGILEHINIGIEFWMMDILDFMLSDFKQTRFQ